MPKKPPKNAFYFFMHDFREVQRKKGVTYANLSEVATAAGPAWTEAPPSVRSKFEAIAKAEKAKYNAPDHKFTSQGVPLSVIEALERERDNAAATELQEITNFVKQKSINESIKDEDFFLIDVNCYCKTTNGTYIIGEFTVLRFSLLDGIKDSYHEIVQPDGIPMGYALDVKLNSKELGLPMPDEGATPSDYIQIIATIVDFLRQRAGNKRGPLPPLYTLPDKVLPVLGFVQELCSRAAEDETKFRIYRLDTLLFQLAQYVQKGPNEGIPKESLALGYLKKDPFKYSPGLACDVHEEIDKAVECTAGRVKRWAYTVFDTCLALFNIAVKPGQHLPPDFHLDSILSYKEERQGEGRVARVAGGNESACSSSLYDSRSDSRVERKRQHVPLRIPTIDYSEAVRSAPALSMSDKEFPPVGGAGRGRGRHVDGRSLEGSFNRSMKM